MPDGDDPDGGNSAHPAIAAPGMDSDFEEDGERVFDVMRAVDHLLQREDVDAQRLLVTGLSMGGEVATFAAALDPRVQLAAPAAYSPDLAVVQHHRNHRCWLWRHADLREYLDVSDLHALIAPRPLVVQTGAQDTVYSVLAAPFAADKQVLRRARVAYADVPERLVHYLQPGRHSFQVGDLNPTTGVRLGLQAPAQSGPSFSGGPAAGPPDEPPSTDWQVDGTTLLRATSLFALLAGR